MLENPTGFLSLALLGNQETMAMTTCKFQISGSFYQRCFWTDFTASVEREIEQV